MVECSGLYWEYPIIFRRKWKETNHLVNIFFKKINEYKQKYKTIMMIQKPFKILLFIVLIFALSSCTSQKVSSIVGSNYDETKNETHYFVLPYGSAVFSGKWEKGNYNTISKQQFFTNEDSINMAIAFGRFDNYEFNSDGSKVGYDFVKSFYEWDSKYFVDSHNLNRECIENDSINNYILYRIFGDIEKGRFDTHFLIGEKNGNTSNFSISNNDNWTANKKIEFLRKLFLTKKEE